MDSHTLIQALIYLGSAALIVPIAVRLGLGSVLGYLIAGCIIGPWGLRQHIKARMRTNFKMAFPAAGRHRPQQMFAMQRRAAMTVSPAVGENFIDPKFEERRNAVPLHRMLPDDQIGARQRLLLGGNIDIEVRIELIKRANFDAFQRPCLFKHPFIRMGMMRIRMRINYKNHR